MVSNVVIVVEPRPAIDKALVTSALFKLGADRVMRGHVALGHGTGGDWHNCFLAMCYGPYGALNRVISAEWSDPIFDIADLLGLTSHEVHAVTDAFDHCLAEFQVLVEEWLELNIAMPVVAIAGADLRGGEAVVLVPTQRGGVFLAYPAERL